MESSTLPPVLPPTGVMSYRLMPSHGRVITLSRSQPIPVTHVKQEFGTEVKENVLPNLQMSAASRPGNFLEHFPVFSPIQRPSPHVITPTVDTKPVIRQEQARPLSPIVKTERKTFPQNGRKSSPSQPGASQSKPHKTGKWILEEDDELRAAIATLGTQSWEKIAYEVQTRSPSQCRDRWTLYLADGLNTRDLSEYEISLMKKLLPTFVRNRKKPWAKLAESFPGRTGTILKNAWKRWENSQKPKRGLSQSSIHRAKREENERDNLMDSTDDKCSDDEESLDERLPPLTLKFKVSDLDALSRVTAPSGPLQSPVRPLPLRSLHVSVTTPVKMSLIPELPSLANSSGLGEISSPGKTFFGGSSFFSPARRSMFSPPRAVNRAPMAVGGYAGPMGTPTPLRSHNPNMRGNMSPLPMWRGLDSSLFDSLESGNPRPGLTEPNMQYMGYGSDLHSSIMIPDMHTTNASISEFNDPASNSGWLFTEPQPGHNPWAV